MSVHYPELAARVHSQRELQPALYGDFDFTATPVRFTTDPGVESALPTWIAAREPLLQDDQVVELMRTATLLGDVVADPYAALAEGLGMKRIIGMLQQACREGVDRVPDAPPELVAFIRAMEATPDWLDMDLVEQGAAASRVPAAFLAPFVLRGAFLGTFTNTYSALPMTLTGALPSRRATRRVHETASFFGISTMPGALQRYGAGFEAAAMVRLMHSMVRVNALTRSDQWDRDVYGLPVPQVDQMPAGLMNVYVLARGALRRGRTEFSRRERAVVEFARYRCFLLGLPEELLPTTPAGIVHVFHARGALLRADFDDTICGELVRSTMDAYLRPTRSWFNRAANAVEKSWSKIGFAQAFCRGDSKAAARMGVHISRGDQLRVLLTALFVFGRFLAVRYAGRSRALGGLADRYATRVLRKRLAMYGAPEFRTDVDHYPT